MWDEDRDRFGKAMSGKISAAMAFLQDAMADGQDHWYATIVANARAAGHTPGSLWHAATRLGVTRQRAVGGSIWSLPDPGGQAKVLDELARLAGRRTHVCARCGRGFSDPEAPQERQGASVICVACEENLRRAEGSWF